MSGVADPVPDTPRRFETFGGERVVSKRARYPEDFDHCDECGRGPGRKCLDLRYARDERRFDTDRPHRNRAWSLKEDGA